MDEHAPEARYRGTIEHIHLWRFRQHETRTKMVDGEITKLAL